MKWFLVGCLCVFVSACSAHQVSTHKAFIKPDTIQVKARHVAVLPLTNHTTFPNAGSIASDLMSTELYALSDFKIMEQTMMLSKLRGEGGDITPVLDRMAALQAGMNLGVDTVIFGSVTEYGYRRGLREDPVVGINARLLDVKTDTILWAGARSRTGGGSLSALAQDVSHDLVKSMLAR